MVAYTANPTQSHTHRVTLDHPVLPSGLVVVGDLPQILVTVTGTAADLTHFDIRTLHASGDFSRVKPGNDRIPIHVENPNPNVQIVAPTSVTIPIDELASATQPVSIERVHALPAGFHELTATTSVTPATVKIDGPKSLLAGAQAIVVVDLSGITGPVDLTPLVVVRDPKKGIVLKGITVTPPQVSVKMTIQADAVTETKPVGWTLTGQPAAGYRVTNVTLSPLQVNATGLLNTLAGLNLVPTDAVDVNGASADVIRTITVRPPAGVAVSQSTVQIHVFISKSPQVSPSASP
ncbi:MAG: CdaR family protein [Candidatus Dormibacteraeota bacterium]|nr:CdaR family protein [Candidatus Dormibacteraeota bacterium]